MNPVSRLSALVMKMLGPAEVGQDSTRIPDVQAPVSDTQPVGDRDGDARLS